MENKIKTDWWNDKNIATAWNDYALEYNKLVEIMNENNICTNNLNKVIYLSIKLHDLIEYPY